jgi:hypothetical protein
MRIHLKISLRPLWPSKRIILKYRSKRVTFGKNIILFSRPDEQNVLKDTPPTI